MDCNDYQERASHTAGFATEDHIYKLMFLSMGLAGETGEVVEKIKKLIRNDSGVLTQEKKQLIVYEMGDVLWYLSQLARELDIPFNAVAEGNLQKLADRAARGVIKSEGDTR